MLIAFWSIIHGQPRTTSNMIAIATTIALSCNRKCLVTQTHFGMNNLEAYLIGDRESSKDVFMDIGLDGLSSIIKLRSLDKETVENYSIPLIHKQLTLLPGTAGGNRTVFTDDMNKTIPLLLQGIKKYYDMIFVDLNSGPDHVSRQILEMADIIVVNLCQNKNMIDHYITSWQPEEKKIMYLIGSYDRNSSYNKHNLKLIYNSLARKTVGVIPYNTEFMDSLSNGEVIRFMKKNYAAAKEDNNSFFIRNVKDASQKLMKIANEVKGGELQ